MPVQTHVLRITPDGATLTCIYSDSLVPSLLDAGRATVRRASHVEPDGAGRWTADLAPVGGPVLGPYTLRQSALDAEVIWIEDNILDPSPKGDSCG